MNTDEKLLRIDEYRIVHDSLDFNIKKEFCSSMLVKQPPTIMIQSGIQVGGSGLVIWYTSWW
jgi:hypothetical protein